MKLFFSSLICLSTLILASCPFLLDTPDRGPSPFDEEDRLTSWESINQLIERPEGWRRIVSNRDQFQLSEESEFLYNSTIIWGGPSGDTRQILSYHNRSYGTFPAIDGSTVLLPLAAEAGWQFLDLSDENTSIFFNFSTTHNAFLRLSGAASRYDDNTSGSLQYFSHTDGDTSYINVYDFEKQPDIILITHPSEDELQIAENRGIELTIRPIAYDSFVFITHINNPVDSLTIEQIRGIYQGLITNWSEVGGADEEIIAFQRNPGSGSQTAMEEMVMGGIRLMDAPAGWYPVGMGVLIDFIAEYQNAPNSIGYSFKYYIDRLYKNPNIKILRVNGIVPSNENVWNNTYPFIASYNGVIRSTDTSNIGGRFLDWLLSAEGQRVIAQAGYVPASP